MPMKDSSQRSNKQCFEAGKLIAEMSKKELLDLILLMVRQRSVDLVALLSVSSKQKIITKGD